METEMLGVSLPKPSLESPVLQTNKFYYDPKADLVFSNWFLKCEDLAVIPEDEKGCYC